MPLSSLPSPYGLGDMGESAYYFIDQLSAHQQSIWQILPLGVYDLHGSPYSALSAFGGNPLFIDLKELQEMGLIKAQKLEQLKNQKCRGYRFDYQEEAQKRYPLLLEASRNYQKGKSKKQVEQELLHFFEERQSLYWMTPLCEYLEKNLFIAHPELKIETTYIDHLFWQYLFHRQWEKIKSYAHQKNVFIFGDIPLFVSNQSMDINQFSQFFKVDALKRPLIQVGAPPDDFCQEGQLWGMTNYDWEVLKQHDFSWWIERIKYQMSLCDILRIDHFIGLENVWESDVDAKNACKGRWVKSQGRELLAAIFKNLPQIKLVAEDLGCASQQVHQLREDFNIPSMRVLQFAFDDSDDNTHHPQNVEANSVYYSGTHDNQTLSQWINSLSEKERLILQKNAIELSVKGFLKTLYFSKASTVMTPFYDHLPITAENHRINTPGSIGDNWNWQCKEEDLKSENWQMLKELTLNSKRGQIRSQQR